MKNFLLITLLFLFSGTTMADLCITSENEKVFCELESKVEGVKLSVQAYNRTCEFPEGNLRPCVKFRICKNGTKSEEGVGVLFEDADLDFYCRQKKQVDLLLSKKGVQAFIECSKTKKSTQKIILKNNSKSKVCGIVYPKGSK